jgi:hypothetical protein
MTFKHLALCAALVASSASGQQLLLGDHLELAGNTVAVPAASDKPVLRLTTFDTRGEVLSIDTSGIVTFSHQATIDFAGLWQGGEAGPLQGYVFVLVNGRGALLPMYSVPIKAAAQATTTTTTKADMPMKSEP